MLMHQHSSSSSTPLVRESHSDATGGAFHSGCCMRCRPRDGPARCCESPGAGGPAGRRSVVGLRMMQALKGRFENSAVLQITGQGSPAFSVLEKQVPSAFTCSASPKQNQGQGTFQRLNSQELVPSLILFKSPQLTVLLVLIYTPPILITVPRLTPEKRHLQVSKDGCKLRAAWARTRQQIEQRAAQAIQVAGWLRRAAELLCARPQHLFRSAPKQTLARTSDRSSEQVALCERP